MTKCRDPEIVLGCFTPNDPELSPVTIEHVTLLSPEGITVATYYQDDTGAVIDPSVFMGGGELSLGSCDLGKTIQCLKDKFIEGGLDNTFTNFTHTNQIYTVTFDNGDVDTFTVPSATGWTDQVNQISAGLDNIMPWAQTVESFCNIAGGCGGLPAPFVELNKMVARYTGFRVCPGDKVPVSVTYKSDQLTKPKELVIQYIETDTIYIDKCIDCSGNVSYLVDGEIYEPVCAIPCEVEFPAVPLALCETIYQDGCDNLNQTDQTNFITIVRAITDCGSGPEINYLIEDVDGALIDYTLIGDFVDCDTGEIISEPTICDTAPFVRVCPELLEPFKTTCADSSTSVTYTNSDNATEMDVSVGGNGDIKITAGGGDGSDNEITSYITTCLTEGKEVEISWVTNAATENTGTATLLPNVTTSPFPNFYNDSVNATGEQNGTLGKLFSMTATCASAEECALRVKVCPEPKKDVEVDTCDGLERVSVDKEVAVRGVVTVKQCPVTPAPVIEVDVEFICNTDTNVYDQIVTTTTDGVPVIAAPVPTTTSCDEDKPDWEVYDMCDLITSTRHTVTVMFETSGQTEISNIDTGVPCVVPTPECVESQEWTYGIDNTGTIYSDVADYVITLSDGSQLEFSQNGTSSSWTPQLIEWSANIQAAADAAGLAWFVEPRAVNNPNPSDISGNYGSTPTGLPGAPSVAVAQALVDGGMVARYVNIQICPGQPVPVSAERVTSTTYTSNPYNLTTAGAILGPIQKFIICRECGKAPVWYLDDGVTLAAAGQIPNCYEPCGTLSLTDSPPDRECTFQTILACDNNNSTITADFIPDITRRATICNGEQIAVDYFQADPTDPSALIPYTLIGRFVDCATGEDILEPVPPCSEFEIAKLYRLIGDGFDGALLNREWQDTQPTTPLFSDPLVATPAGRAIRDAHDFSLPTSNSGTQATLALNDQDNTAAELSIQVLDGFIEVESGGWFRYSGTSEGYWAVELGQCCGPLMDVAESGGFSSDRVMEFYLPTGLHQVRLWNVDSGGSNSSATFGYSLDGGITYINDNTPPNISFGSVKIKEECLTVKVCEDSGAIFNLLTGELLDPADLYTCSRTCEDSSCSCESSSGSGEVFDGNVTDITPNPDQTHVLVSGTGNVPAGLKTVTINNITGTTTIDGGFALGQGRRVDSISFDATEIDRARGLLPAMTLAGGTWQWVGLQPIAEV